MKKLPAFQAFLHKTEKIGVVGLGYVGLPLAVHLSRHFSVVGFDVSAGRVAELKKGLDRTQEVSREDLQSGHAAFTNDPKQLRGCRVVIVAVPTPIDGARVPDLGPMRSASALVGRHLAVGSCVVYESTVYPGVTEEVCVPILEQESGLAFGKDFSVGYSPERINPGDKIHTLDKVVKIVAASDAASLKLLSRIYGRIVQAGIYEASSIRVAEAAKVIENTQRDINIALMNELAVIFRHMGIDTLEVLDAAGTKWNFLPFRPGLVGGHCIGVDPYYLTFKAESLGYHPSVILAGRRINDGMGRHIGQEAVRLLIAGGVPVRGSRVAILGLTFKENVPDIRNTKVVDILQELRRFGAEVTVSDPDADPGEVREHYGLELTDLKKVKNADLVVVAVAHDPYKTLGLARIAALCGKKRAIVMDVKGLFSAAEAKKLGIAYWSL